VVRVLFVESHETFARTVVTEFLADFDVTIAPSLAGARSALAVATFDVLLVDDDLDDGKGDELVREVRASGFRGRIVAASAHEARVRLSSPRAPRPCAPKAQFRGIASARRRGGS
jgi:DNA-binding response OmpR family regulator